MGQARSRYLVRARKRRSPGIRVPVEAELKDGSPVQLVLADKQDIEPLRRLYRVKPVAQGCAERPANAAEAWNDGATSVETSDRLVE